MKTLHYNFINDLLSFLAQVFNLVTNFNNVILDSILLHDIEGKWAVSMYYFKYNLLSIKVSRLNLSMSMFVLKKYKGGQKVHTT